MAPESTSSPCSLPSVPRPLYPLLLVFVLTFAVFLGCLNNEFVNFDDAQIVFQNPSIQSLRPSAVLRLFLSFDSSCYVPLSRLSLALDYALWGQNPFGYHLTSILLHSINACLVFLLVRKILSLVPLPSFEPRTASKSPLAAYSLQLTALFSSLLFSLHPLRVESVAWASERRDVLSGFFVLLSTLAYLRAFDPSPISRPRASWLRLSTVFFYCSLLAKANAVGLPMIFLILDIHPLGRIRAGTQDHPKNQFLCLVLEKWRLWLGALLAAAIAIWGQRAGGALPDTQWLDWKTRLAISMVSSVHYLEKFLFPFHLNVLYLLNRLYSWHDGIVWLGLFLISALTFLFLWIRHRWPASIWIWLSYLLLIGPFLGFLQIGRALAADRYTYLASIPLAIGIGGWFGSLWNRLEPPARRPLGRMALVAVAGGILIWWTLGTAQQIRVWRNSVSLWRHSLSVDPTNPFAWRNLSDALQSAGKPEQALLCAQQAVHLFPDHEEHWFDLGGYCLSLNRYPEALAAYQQCVRLAPGFREAYHNMGVVCLKQGNPGRALQYLAAAQKLGTSPATTFTMACCHEQLGEGDAALRGFREAANEGVADAWIHWSDLVSRKDDLHASLDILREGIRRTRHPKIEMAFLETVLLLPDPQPVEIQDARDAFQELNEQTHGQSRKMMELQRRMENWPKNLESQKP